MLLIMTLLKLGARNPGDQIIAPTSSCSSDPASPLRESPRRHTYSVCAGRIFLYSFFVARSESVTVGISQESRRDSQIITLKGKVCFLISLRFYLFYIIYCAENKKDLPTWLSANFPGVHIKLFYSLLEKSSLQGRICPDLQ